MNSAMMPQPGSYKLERLTKAQFVGILRDEGAIDSYVGYPQTAEFVERISGIKCEVSRRPAVLVAEEAALVVKLAYRPQDANAKGQQVNEDDYEFYLMIYFG